MCLQQMNALPPFQSPGPESFFEGVQKYQKQHGLSDDGIIGPNTWGHLKQSISGSTSNQPDVATPEQENELANNGTMQAQAQAHWAAHPTVHRYYDNDLQKYTTLLPLYRARGILNPAEYIENNIIEVTFFGRRTPAHRDMAAPLAEAEAALQEQDFQSDIRRFWSFKARASSSGRLSQHAVGRAADINSPENPFVKDSTDIEVIQAVTGINLGDPQDVEASIQASEDFQAEFYPGMDQATEPSLKTQNSTAPESVGSLCSEWIPKPAEVSH